ncbi:MAG: multicopper oxidase family protein [Acidiferrobacterales bacterium]
MSDKASRSKLTRRHFLKLGAAAGLIAGAPYIITSKKGALLADIIPSANAQMTPGGNGLPGGSSSPPVTPFTVEMPLPPVKTPVPFLSPAPDTSQFQYYSQFPAKEYYDVDVKEFLQSFHPTYPLNTMWGYDGMFPGVLFKARYGTPMIVRFRNNLPAISTGFGDPHIITHQHNGHNGSESDGFPGDFYTSGTYKDDHYPFMLAGGDPNEALNTLWYHDHMLEFTAANTYKGLAGPFFLFDEVDSDDETDTNPRALRLPSGNYDVPLFLADKQFDANGALVFSQTDLNGFVGDRFTVNGVIQPFFKVARRKYRLRFFNGGPSRWYGIKFSNGMSFQLIATDGNLLDSPSTLTRFIHAPAERYDIVVDFSQFPIGTQIVLQNDVAQTSGRGPSGTLASPIQLMRFDVDSDAFDPSQVPATLRPLPPIPTPTVTRNWQFQNMGGAWLINGRLFDVNRVDATVKRGAVEQWNLSSMGDWSHPIHIHLEEGRILPRGDVNLQAQERGRKDIYRLGSTMGGIGIPASASVVISFRDMLGKYVMHCHNTVHEDHAMMIRFDVVA